MARGYPAAGFGAGTTGRAYDPNGCADDGHDIFGRAHGDHEKLFPRYTNATAAHAEEIVVNGKRIAIWEYAQLEALSSKILRSRANELRTAIGENNCPPMPSAQPQDMVKWILHVQNQLIGRELEVGRHGRGSQVPAHFLQEAKARPIQTTLPSQGKQPRGGGGFGPRMNHNAPGHNPSRDHYDDLLEQRNEFAEAQTLGIQTMRIGGEGRKPIGHKSHMENVGTSTASPGGIQSLKAGGEGRRHLGCVDHMAEQKREAQERDFTDSGPTSCQEHTGAYDTVDSRSSPGCAPRPHVSDHHMGGPGIGAPKVEPSIGGERRRHLPEGSVDHMVNNGTSEDGGIRHSGFRKAASRKRIDLFQGPGHGHSGSHETYSASWKRNPSRLMGTSLIV